MRLRAARVSVLAATLPVVLGGCSFITRVSVDTGGGDPGGSSGSAGVSTSGDGRYIAFESAAPDLVPGDRNGVQDVFVRDLVTGQTQRVSVDRAGGDPSGSSLSPSISDDGRYVAFDSHADDLVDGDGNPFSDVFVRDLHRGTTTRVSVAAGGGDPDSGNSDPSISDDGRFVAFDSGASNLVTGDVNGTTDVYVRDRATGTTTRVSVDTGGGDPDALSTHPAISADGRYVAFQSRATDLVAGDTDVVDDVFVRDLHTGTTVRASVGAAPHDSPNAASQVPSISADGRYVAFSTSQAFTEFFFGEVYVRDVVAGTTTLVSVDTAGGIGDGDDISSWPSISGDGRYVAFQSTADDLVHGDANGVSDVFVRDRVAGSTTRASVSLGGDEASAASRTASISRDGRYVAFVSAADDLVPEDGTSGLSGSDIFLRATTAPTVEQIAPQTLARGTTASLLVTGTGFFPGTIASAKAFGPGGVTVDSTTVVSETELTVVVTVAPDAPTGPRNVLAFRPGTGPGTLATSFGLCPGCLTIT